MWTLREKEAFFLVALSILGHMKSPVSGDKRTQNIRGLSFLKQWSGRYYSCLFERIVSHMVTSECKENQDSGDLGELGPPKGNPTLWKGQH
jgi:hypothetical protein